MTRIQANDDSALDTLAKRHRPYLRKIIRNRLDDRLASRLDASDLIQETLLEAFTRIRVSPEKFEQLELPFRLWLRQLAIDRVKMAERRHLYTQKRGLYREVIMPEHSSILLAQQLLKHEPQAELEKREIIEAVQAAMKELSATDREVLTLRTFEGLTYDEITILTGVSAPTARQRHGRALVRLHDSLKSFLSGSDCE